MSHPSSPRAGLVRRLVESLANFSLLAIALAGCIMLIKQLPTAPRRTIPEVWSAPSEPLSAGSAVTLPGVDFDRADRSLVLVLSTQCHFSTASAPFYRQLIAEARRASAQVVAVLPQPADEGRAYLAGLGIAPDAVVQAPLASLGASRTPTLILADGHGLVTHAWVGRVPPLREQQVLDALGSRAVE